MGATGQLVRDADGSVRKPDFTALGKWIDRLSDWSQEMVDEVRRLERLVAQLRTEKEDAAHEFEGRIGALEKERDSLADIAEAIADVQRGVLQPEELFERYERYGARP